MNKAEKAALRAQAKADFQSGMSYREIAAKYGVGLGSVARWAEKDGWDQLERNRNAVGKRNSGTEHLVQELAVMEPEEPQEEPQEQEQPAPVIACADWTMMRETALLALERINQRLRSEKPLEPRDIKSITGALLDLKNQLNALSPRELREMALRLRSLEKQTETTQAEPVVVTFVNREWDNADN